MVSGAHSVAINSIDAVLPFQLSEGESAAWNVGVVLAVVVVVFSVQVLAHELGHAHEAVQHGVNVDEVVLRAGGGVAVLEEDPPTPTAELHISSGGPIASLIVIFVLTIVYLLGAAAESSAVATVAALSSVATIGLIVSNLVPVYILDGGRILRAVLARRIGYQQATLATVYLSYGIAMGLGVVVIVTGHYPLLLVWAYILLFTPAVEQARTDHQQPENTSAPTSQ